MAEDTSAKLETAIKQEVIKHGLRYDPEWARIAAQAPKVGDLPVKDEWEDLFELRDFTENILHHVFRLSPYPEEVEETKTEFDSPDGTHKFTVSRFATAEQRAAPKEGEALRPAILVSSVMLGLEMKGLSD